MTRIIRVGAAQSGPVQKDDNRNAIIRRLVELMRQAKAQKCDVVVFTEAVTHGTLVWQGEHQRRALLYKFSPGILAFSGGAHNIEYADFIEKMEPEHRAVMEAPHYRR